MFFFVDFNIILCKFIRHVLYYNRTTIYLQIGDPQIGLRCTLINLNRVLFGIYLCSIWALFG